MHKIDPLVGNLGIGILSDWRRNRESDESININMNFGWVGSPGRLTLFPIDLKAANRVRDVLAAGRPTLVFLVHTLEWNLLSFHWLKIFSANERTANSNVIHQRSKQTTNRK